MYFSFKLTRLCAAIFFAALLTAVCLAIAYNFARLIKTQADAEGVPHKKAVYLTFDDGPSENTADVLDALERHGVKATFFVTAQRMDNIDILSKQAAAGHLVALHSYSHDFGNIYADSGAFWEDIERLQGVIETQTGARASILRFPGGSSNTVASRSLMRSLAQESTARGYIYFDWNVDTRDALGSVKSAEYIAERAVKGALREPIPVILMHDAPTNTTAAQALDIIIPLLKEKGCVFATLDELAQPVQHSLN